MRHPLLFWAPAATHSNIIKKRYMEESHDIVIVGGGICGLATALALHR
jgi:glycerol-3-phosphate dehydrogenase